MVQICLVEAGIPETKLYGVETLHSRGGIVADNNNAAITIIQMLQGENYLDYIRTNNFKIIGAYLDQCIGWLTLNLFETYEVSSITLDMKKSFSSQEKLNFPNRRTILTTNEREQILWSSHPELGRFRDKLTIIK